MILTAPSIRLDDLLVNSVFSIFSSIECHQCAVMNEIIFFPEFFMLQRTSLDPLHAATFLGTNKVSLSLILSFSADNISLLGLVRVSVSKSPKAS